MGTTEDNKKLDEAISNFNELLILEEKLSSLEDKESLKELSHVREKIANMEEEIGGIMNGLLGFGM